MPTPNSGGPDRPEASKKVREVNLSRTYKERPSIAEQKEKGRIWVAMFLLIILLIVVVLSFFTWPETKELVSIIVPAITGLVGLAVGHYFGSQSAQGGD